MHFGTGRNLVISGASGFVGRAVASAADDATVAGSIGSVRRIVRDPGVLPRGTAGTAADLTDPESLERALDGATVLVHAAGYRGSDSALQRKVNVDGTRAIVAAAAAVGIERVVLVSTTAVYGSGAHRGVMEGQLVPHPESPLSESRLEAEDIVLRAGGCVVRADLTYGDGDRWVVPGLVRVQRMLGGAVDDGAALTSAIAVRDLGRLLVAVAATSSEVSGRVFHAAAHPVPLSALLGVVDAAVGLGLSARPVRRADALPLLRREGLTLHQIDLMTSDHWYDGSTLWTLARLRSPIVPSIDARAADWYAQILKTESRGVTG